VAWALTSNGRAQGPGDERIVLIGDRLDELDPKFFEVPSFI
jgi:hypothetical protein